MLDVPNFFWDSEPTLHPLYAAVREYLEIKPRIQVLNERCRVFLDLAEILSDSINDRKMSRASHLILPACSPYHLITNSCTSTQAEIIANTNRTHLDHNRPNHPLNPRNLLRSLPALRHPIRRPRRGTEIHSTASESIVWEW